MERSSMSRSADFSGGYNQASNFSSSSALRSSWESFQNSSLSISLASSWAICRHSLRGRRLEIKQAIVEAIKAVRTFKRERLG